MSSIAIENKSSSKIKVAAISSLIVLGLAGFGGYFFLTADNKVDPSTQVSEKPLFVNIEPMIINLADRDDERFAQISVVIETRSEAASALLRTVEPVLKSRSMLIVSRKLADNLKSAEGKKNLRNEIMDMVLITMADNGGSDLRDTVRDVHFSTLVIQ